MAQCVNKIHSAEHKKNCLQNRKDYVNKPQHFCRSSNFCRNLAFFRPGRFRLYKLKSAYAQKRKKRNRKRDNSHSAKPVSHTPPQIHTARQFFYFRKDCRSCCGKAGNAFKKCVRKRRNATAYAERHCAEKACKKPG